MDFSSFDAFNAGVKEGGLRNRSEIRLLVCYLLRAIDRAEEPACGRGAARRACQLF